MEKNRFIEGWKAQTEYVCEYDYGGQKWALNIFAVDDADAQLRMQCIRDSFQVLGKLEGVIPFE